MIFKAKLNFSQALSNQCLVVRINTNKPTLKKKQ